MLGVIHLVVDVVLQHPALPPAVFLQAQVQLVSHLHPLPHFSEVHLQSKWKRREIKLLNTVQFMPKLIYQSKP